MRVPDGIDPRTREPYEYKDTYEPGTLGPDHDEMHQAFVRQSRRSDPVNSPSHYNGTGVETIDSIRSILGEDGFRAFCRGNVLKYTARAERKGHPAEDYAKAAWYARMAAGDDPRKDAK